MSEMLPLYRSAQVRAMDAHAIGVLGVPSYELMCRAGAAAWRLLHHTEDDDVHAVAVEKAATLSDAEIVQRSFFPITFPLTTGPGTMRSGPTDAPRRRRSFVLLEEGNCGKGTGNKNQKPFQPEEVFFQDALVLVDS